MKKQIVLLLLAVCMCLLTACQPSQPSISISEDGYWIINGEKTDVKAQGPQGEKGEDATVTDENPLGLAFFLKDDGTYVVEIGQAKYLSIITIPATYKGKAVTEIGKEGFRDSSNLTSITIPDSITKIADVAFLRCSNLTSVTIPDSVTSIGDQAFSDCSGLTSVAVGNSVTSIGNSAFAGCSSLTSVTIPDSVSSIGDSAFNSCSGLTSVTIPDSVTSIGNSAFAGCSGLTSVTIPDSVTSIGGNAFQYCSNLTSVTIGNSVTSIGGGAFNNCISLKEIFFNATAANDLEYSIFYNACGTGSKVIIGANVKKIPSSLFITSSYSPCITSVEFEEGSICESIGENAFNGCYSLTSILIPDSVTSIGKSAFAGCSGLTSVTIGNSVTEIGMYAFARCSSLTSVYYKGTKERWNKLLIEYDNIPLVNATRYYYSENEPTKEGNFWHYVDGEIVVWPRKNEA